MAWVNVGARSGLRSCLLSFAAIAAALSITSDAAVARHHHRVYAHAARHHSHGGSYDPPYASIVIDGNSGTVLQATNPDALRHPASLTKVMTLYLLFERLDAGKIRLDTPLKVSEHASEQDPTKLELKPGQTITVEDAIKGIVTKSANDAAVVIAENLGGSEEAFAKLMTQKAHALGMTHTTYVNASGLPDDDQNTTARDQALLGRAIQDGFPRYYKYFSTQAFEFRGRTIRGHDHLLTEVEGVDGIKTGFTRASGFNLLTSMHRDGRYLVAVVLGGPSSSERDARMRELLAEHVKEAAVHRTAPMIADVGVRREEPIAFAKAPMVAAPAPAAPVTVARAEPPATASADRPAAGANDTIKPVLVKTITYRTVPVQTATLAPMPMLVPVAPRTAQATPAPQAAPAQAQAVQAQAVQAQAVESQVLPAQTNVRPQPVAAAVEPPRPTVVASATPGVDLRAAAPQQPQPAASVVPAAPKANVVARAPAAEPVAAEPARIEPEGIEIATAERVKLQAAVPSAPIRAHGGWLIQIGAFDDENDAKQHLSAAQIKVHATLAAKDPFTERIQKGDKALYRARFAGFDKVTAEAACRELKRSDFQCMALKD